MEKLLVDASEARAILGGIGEKLFRSLGVPARMVGKRKKYHLDDLKSFARNLERIEPCQSRKEPGRRGTGTTSRSRAPGFEEALKQTIRSQPRPLKENSGQKPCLALISSGNPV